MKGFWLEGLFAEKHLIVSPYFQVLAFLFQFRLTILGEQLSTNKHGGKQLSFINQREVLSSSINHHHLPLLTLCGSSIKQSH